MIGVGGDGCTSTVDLGYRVCRVGSAGRNGHLCLSAKFGDSTHLLPRMLMKYSTSSALENDSGLLQITSLIRSRSARRDVSVSPESE